VILVLCGAGDASAHAVHSELLRRGKHALLADWTLLDRAQISVTLGENDGAELALPGLPVLRPSGVNGIFNRCAYPRQPPGADGAYIAEERFATYVTLLGAFRCVNAASPAGLAGCERPAPVVRHLAALAGLPAAPWRAGMDAAAPARTALVVGKRVFGLPPCQHEAACALAGFLDLRVVGLLLDRAGDVVGATPLPDLVAAGPEAIAAVASLLAS